MQIAFLFKFTISSSCRKFCDNYTPKVIQQIASKCVDSVARRAYCVMSIFAMRRPRQHPLNVAQFTSGFCTLFVRHSQFYNHAEAQIYRHRVRIYSNPSHSPAAMRIIWQNNPPRRCKQARCCPTHPKFGSLIPCARIPNVTWVQLCFRFQQIAKHRVDLHPAVTAVSETPRAPISIAMCDFASAFAAIYKLALGCAKVCYGKTQQLSAVCVRSSFVPA